MIPVFALTALFLILGAAIASNKTSVKSPIFAVSVPAKQAQSLYPETDDGVITSLALNVTTQQVKTNDGESYNFTGSGFTTNNAVTIHIRKPDNIEVAPIIINTDIHGQFSFMPDASVFNQTGDYSCWIIDNSTNQFTKTIIISITNITPKMDNASVPTPLLQGQYYIDATSSNKWLESHGLGVPIRLLELFPDADFSLIWGDFDANGKWKSKGTATLILECDSLTMLDVPSTYTVSTRNNNTVLIANRSYGEFVWVRH